MDLKDYEIALRNSLIDIEDIIGWNVDCFIGKIVLEIKCDNLIPKHIRRLIDRVSEQLYGEDRISYIGVHDATHFSRGYLHLALVIPSFLCNGWEDPLDKDSLLETFTNTFNELIEDSKPFIGEVTVITTFSYKSYYDDLSLNLGDSGIVEDLLLVWNRNNGKRMFLYKDNKTTLMAL